ncbi:MAG: hypothetical protein MJ177_04500 [Clostridia bacterium]|nr:hypothetical protein [Clostridia bacterium]
MKTDNKNKVINSGSFNAQSAKKSKLTKDIVILFLAAVALVAAVSLIVALKENDFKFRNIIASVNPGAETTTEETTVPDSLSGKVNFLLSCQDTSTGNPRFIAILNTNLNNLSMRMYVLEQGTTVTANDYTGNLNEHFLHGGMTQLVLAVEELTGISIERYICADDKNFLEATKLFDNITYEVPQTVVFAINGISYTLDAGRQEMTPDTVQKYLIHLCQSRENVELSNLLCSVINSYLTPINAMRSETVFKKLSNLFDTDISAMDYAKYKEKISSFINNEQRVPAVYSADTQDF